MTESSWDAYFMAMVDVVASRSKDMNSKYGAVLVRPHTNSVVATGYNGIPRGIKYDESYHLQPDKRMWFVHAEQNAVFNAAQEGVSTKGTMLYVIHIPCVECAKAIVQSGVAGIIYKEMMPIPTVILDKDDWRLNMEAATQMYGAAGISVRKAVL